MNMYRVVLVLMLQLWCTMGCTNTEACGIGTFCFDSRCVQCVSNNDCQDTCTCSFGSCLCPAEAFQSSKNLINPAGLKCSKNTVCRVGEYCYNHHCVVNGALTGCSEIPHQGRCKAVPETSNSTTSGPTTSSSDDDALLIAFIVTLLLLVLIICILIVLLAKYSKSKKQKAASDEKQPDEEEPQEAPLEAKEMKQENQPRQKRRRKGENGSRRDTHSLTSPGPTPRNRHGAPVSTQPGTRGSSSLSASSADMIVWLSKDEQNKLGLTYTGTKVTATEQGGPADKAGIKPGMKILAVSTLNSKMRNDTAAVQEAFREAIEGPQPFVVYLKRPAEASDFQVGDKLEVMYLDRWMPATVTAQPDPDSNVVTALPSGWEAASSFPQFRKIKTKRQPLHAASAKDLPNNSFPPTPLSSNYAKAFPGKGAQESRQTIPTPVKPVSTTKGSLPPPPSPRSEHRGEVTPPAALARARSRSPSSVSSTSLSEPARGKKKRVDVERELSPVTYEPPTPKLQLDVGNEVLANFNGTWHRGRIGACDYVNGHGKEPNYDVNWGDGTMTKGLFPSEVRPLYPDGTLIQAFYRDDWWNAVITDFHEDGTYTIEWDDGTITHGVIHSDIRPK